LVIVTEGFTLAKGLLEPSEGNGFVFRITEAQDIKPVMIQCDDCGHTITAIIDDYYYDEEAQIGLSD
jgi:hypothetical protein